MLEALNKLEDSGLAELNAAPDAPALEQWRIKYLGTKGAVKDLMNLLATAPKEQKKDVGQRVNAAKSIEKNAHLDDIGDLIVIVGLTGTAIGVVMMLQSFNPESLSDPAKVVETATMLGNGIGTAFRSTIVSAVVWMVHIINLRMLKTATVAMIEDAR